MGRSRARVYARIPFTPCGCSVPCVLLLVLVPILFPLFVPMVIMELRRPVND